MEEHVKPVPVKAIRWVWAALIVLAIWAIDNWLKIGFLRIEGLSKEDLVKQAKAVPLAQAGFATLALGVSNIFLGAISTGTRKQKPNPRISQVLAVVSALALLVGVLRTYVV